MARVDLYLLKGSNLSDQVDFCCRLAEKALSQHPKIYIQTTELIQDKALDDALWSFKKESFLPHIINSKTTHPELTAATPIIIDHLPFEENLIQPNSLLITLCKSLPENLFKFDRLCLIILNNDTDIENARTLYKHIKKQNLEVHIHDLR